MNVLFWGPGDFPVSYSNRDTSCGMLEIVIQEVLWSIRWSYSAIWSPLSRLLNDILTVSQQWLPNRSDFLPSSWPWYWGWPLLNYTWFSWIFCDGCGMPAGNAYTSTTTVWPSDHREDYRSCAWPFYSLVRPFLKHCTLTNNVVGTIWRALSKLLRGARVRIFVPSDY